MNAGAHTLRNLSPSYVVGTASRTLHAAVRSLSKGSSFGGWLGVRLGLPPLLVAAPIVAQPIRAIAGLAIILMVLAFGVPGLVVPDPSTVALATIVGGIAVGVGFVLIVLAIVSELRVARNWRLLPEGLRTDLVDRHRRAQRYSVGSQVVAALGFIGALVFLYVDDGLSARFWLLYILGAGLALYAGRVAAKLPAPPIRRWSTLFWVITAGLAVLIGLFAPLLSAAAADLAPAAVEWTEDRVAFRLAVSHGVISWLLVLVLGWGWMGAGRRGWQRGLTLAGVGAVCGLLVFAAVWGLLSAFGGNAVFTIELAAAALAWIVGSHAFWWSGGFHRLSMARTPSDRAAFDTPAPLRRSVGTTGGSSA
jgi:hypothetical protein